MNNIQLLLNYKSTFQVLHTPIVEYTKLDHLQALCAMLKEEYFHLPISGTPHVMGCATHLGRLHKPLNKVLSIPEILATTHVLWKTTLDTLETTQYK